MVEPVSKSARGADRKERILSSAADLMARDGYPAVSMIQIGAAAGIVGSGVYRHFDSKSTILRVLLDRVIAKMAAGTTELVATGREGIELLDAMMVAHAEIASANRSLVAVYLRDSGNLPEGELRTVVQALFSLINSAATYENPLPDAVLVDRISSMAIATMRAGLGLAPR